MKGIETAKLLLAIGLVISVSANIWLYNSNQQLSASLSGYSEPLVLDSYSITEAAITIMFWNQGTDTVEIIGECEVNDWNPSSFNWSARTVPPNGTVSVTVNGPIMCQNASYKIKFYYYDSNGEYVFRTRIPRGTIIYEPAITLEQAMAIGREFLDSRNYMTGNAGGVLTVLEPNNYWHSMFGIENTAQPGFQHCWYVTFEKGGMPGHYFWLFVNSESGEVIGGIQCL